MTRLKKQADLVFLHPTDPPWDGRPDEKRDSGLSVAEETALLDAWRFDRDESARDRLVEAYLPMARGAARTCLSPHVDLDRQEAAAEDGVLRILDKMPAEGFGSNGSLGTLHTYLATTARQRALDAIIAATCEKRSPVRLGGHLVRWQDGTADGFRLDETVPDTTAVRADEPSGAKRIVALFDAAALSKKERILILNELANGNAGNITGDGKVFVSKKAAFRARKSAVRRLAEAAKEQESREKTRGP